MAASPREAAGLWDVEYARRGIPSSAKDGPSAAVDWALDNLARCGARLAEDDLVLDVGCGTGRNAVAVAARAGCRVAGFDYAPAAISAARERAARQPAHVAARLTFAHGDLREGLPAASASVALALDVFVSFHVTDPGDRARYVGELRRVLRPGGVLLLSLADATDGYYAACPPVPGAGALNVVTDPHTDVPNVLHSLDTLRAELAPAFRLAMSWHKETRGPMHGGTYDRVILNTLWTGR